MASLNKVTPMYSDVTHASRSRYSDTMAMAIDHICSLVSLSMVSLRRSEAFLI